MENKTTSVPERFSAEADYFKKKGYSPVINETTGEVSGITQEDFDLWFKPARAMLTSTPGQSILLVFGKV